MFLARKGFTQVATGDSVLNTVINVAVGILVFGILGSIALDQFMDVDTGDWSDQLVQVWEVLPVIGIVAVLLAFIAMAVRRL